MARRRYGRLATGFRAGSGWDDGLLTARAGSTDTQQWERVDAAVQDAGRRALVGRRILPLSGPFGAGVQVVPEYVFRGTDRGGIDLLGESDTGIVRASERRFLPIPLLYKDFRLHWRDPAGPGRAAPDD